MSSEDASLLARFRDQLSARLDMEKNNVSPATMMLSQIVQQMSATQGAASASGMPPVSAPAHVSSRRIQASDFPSVKTFHGSSAVGPGVLEFLDIFHCAAFTLLTQEYGESAEAHKNELITLIFHFLRDDASTFYVQIMQGRIPWRRNVDKSTDAHAPPSTWDEMRFALEDRYLPTDAMPCVVIDLVNFKQAPGEDAARHLDRYRLLWSRFDRLLARRGETMRAELEIGLYERSLEPELLAAQRREPYVTSLLEASDRVRRNQVSAITTQTESAMQWSTVAKSRPQHSRGGNRSRSKSRTRQYLQQQQQQSNQQQSSQQQSKQQSQYSNQQPQPNPPTCSNTLCNNSKWHTYDQCFKNPDPAVAEANRKAYEERRDARLNKKRRRPLRCPATVVPTTIGN